jgi:Skp family chaperone for outer membrane proteins
MFRQKSLSHDTKRNARSANVRVIVQSVSLLTLVAFAALAPASARAEGPGPVAVIDVAKIFKEDPSIKAEVAKVENDLKTIDAELKGRQNELKAAAEQLKTFKLGTAEYAAQEEVVAGMESKLRLDMARKRKELSDAEAKIYYDNYNRISAAVEKIASYHKIGMVLRYNSEDMDLEKGESVIRGVMKSIVYYDKALDMTPAVMTYMAQNPDSTRQAAADTTTR